MFLIDLFWSPDSQYDHNDIALGRLETDSSQAYRLPPQPLAPAPAPAAVAPFAASFAAFGLFEASLAAALVVLADTFAFATALNEHEISTAEDHSREVARQV
jgi:hypothetical protein